MNLQEVLNKAAADAQEFHAAEAVVIEDEAKLAADKSVKQEKAATAQASLQDGVTALMAELAALPAVPVAQP